MRGTGESDSETSSGASPRVPIRRLQAQPLGYYQKGISNLKAYLEGSPDHAKLVRVQSHLISNRLASRPEFKDPRRVWGVDQRAAYVEVVRSVRPDLDEELILRLLPKPPG